MAIAGRPVRKRMVYNDITVNTAKSINNKPINYTACQPSTDPMIMKLVRNGVGMRSISRIMNIVVSTVIRKVKRIAEKTIKSIAFRCCWYAALANSKAYQQPIM